MTGHDWDRHRRRALVARRNGAASRPMSLAEVPPGVSGFRGVHFQRDKGKYRAAIEIGGLRRHLGYFEFATAAAHAYDRAALEAWGTEAAMNFPSGEARASAFADGAAS